MLLIDAGRSDSVANSVRPGRRLPRREPVGVSRLRAIPEAPAISVIGLAGPEAAVLRAAAGPGSDPGVPALLQARGAAAAGHAGLRRRDDVPLLCVCAAAQPADWAGVTRTASGLKPALFRTGRSAG